MVREDYEYCFAKCDVPEVEDFYCCRHICSLEKMSLIIDGDFGTQALISSFSASVDYDTAWMYIIETSVERCYNTGLFTQSNVNGFKSNFPSSSLG